MKKPNIILSIADDLGSYDVGWRNARFQTPVLDSYVAQGIEMERHYMHRFCSPSRSMLLGGIHPFRHGQQTDINLNPISMIPCAVQEDIPFLPQVFHSAGYKTHMVGKWHLGHHQAKFTPTGRGFETFVGFYSGSAYLMDSDGEDRLVTEKFKKEICWCDGYPGLNIIQSPMFENPFSCLKKCRRGAVLMNDTAADGIRLASQSIMDQYEYGDELLGDEAARIIEQHPADSPLFLVMSWIAPHAPVQSPAKYYANNEAMRQAFKNKKRPTCEENLRLKYSGMLKALDEQHAKVQKALEARGMWENSLLVFMSDNGGHDEKFVLKGRKSCKSDGANFVKSGSNFPLRGGKFTNWEGGVRTVSFAYSPNKNIIPENRRGTRWSGLVSGVDWAKTLVQAAQLPESVLVPWEAKGFAPDSQNFWTELLTGQESPRHEIPVQINSDVDRYVVIQKDQASGNLFKYIVGYPGYVRGVGYARGNRVIPKSDPGNAIRFPEELSRSDADFHLVDLRKSKKQHRCIDKPCLFDIDNDPSEMDNLRGAKEFRSIEQSAKEMIERYKKTEVTFEESGLCDVSSSDLNSWRTMQLADYRAVQKLQKCKAFVPWADLYADCPSRI